MQEWQTSVFFKSKVNCEDDGNLTKAEALKIQTIIRFSKEYNDDISITLEEKLKENQDLTYKMPSQLRINLHVATPTKPPQKTGEV